MVGKNANLSLPGETTFSVHAQIFHIFLCQPLAPITLQNDNLGLYQITSTALTQDFCMVRTRMLISRFLDDMYR